MKLVNVCIAFCVILLFAIASDALTASNQVSDVSFITTENGTRIHLKVSGPVQIARKQLKGFVAFTISPARYVADTTQIRVQNPFVDFIYAVQRTELDVYVLIKLKYPDSITKIINDSGKEKIIVEILTRPKNYPAPVTEKTIPPEKEGAPYTPESEVGS